MDSSQPKFNCDAELLPDDNTSLQVLNFIQAVVCVIALLLNAYIVFSYNFKRHGEPFKAHQCFTVMLFLQTAISAFLQFLHFLLYRNPSFLVLGSFFAWVQQTDVVFATFILACHRFYFVCKPIKNYLRVFSTKRIIIYFIVYLLLLIFGSVFELIFCTLRTTFVWGISVLVECLFFLLVYFFTLVYTAYAYFWVIKNMNLKIKRESVHLIGYSDLEDSSQSDDVFSGSESLTFHETTKNPKN